MRQQKCKATICGVTEGKKSSWFNLIYEKVTGRKNKPWKEEITLQAKAKMENQATGGDRRSICIQINHKYLLGNALGLALVPRVCYCAKNLFTWTLSGKKKHFNDEQGDLFSDIYQMFLTSKQLQLHKLWKKVEKLWKCLESIKIVRLL